MIEPTRREQPHKFLDASLVPLERALMHRADVLAEESKKPGTRDQGMYNYKYMLAVELRTIAEELHYW